MEAVHVFDFFSSIVQSAYSDIYLLCTVNVGGFTSCGKFMLMKWSKCMASFNFKKLVHMTANFPLDLVPHKSPLQVQKPYPKWKGNRDLWGPFLVNQPKWKFATYDPPYMNSLLFWISGCQTHPSCKLRFVRYLQLSIWATHWRTVWLLFQGGQCGWPWDGLFEIKTMLKCHPKKVHHDVECPSNTSILPSHIGWDLLFLRVHAHMTCPSEL